MLGKVMTSKNPLMALVMSMLVCGSMVLRMSLYTASRLRHRIMTAPMPPENCDAQEYQKDRQLHQQSCSDEQDDDFGKNHQAAHHESVGEGRAKC